MPRAPGRLIASGFLKTNGYIYLAAGAAAGAAADAQSQ